MRHNGKITAALLMAALAAVACSKDQTSQPAGKDQQQVRPKTISMITPAANKQPDETAANIVGPVSFADGEAAYHSGKYGEATRVFERYTLEKPNNAWGHFMLGLSASKGGDPEKAKKAFEDALRIDPNHIKSLLSLSRVLIDQGRFDDAFVKLTQAGELDPNSAEMYRLLGRAYNGQKKIDDAIDAYRQAIALDANDAWSLNNLGLIFIEQGRAFEAVPLLTKAVELRKDAAMFHNNLGMALEHAGHFTAAASAYSGALTADPGYEKAKRNLARVEAVKAGPQETAVSKGDTLSTVDEKQPPITNATVSQ